MNTDNLTHFKMKKKLILFILFNYFDTIVAGQAGAGLGRTHSLQYMYDQQAATIDWNSLGI